MSQNQDSNDPYTEYQDILAQGNTSRQGHPLELYIRTQTSSKINTEIPYLTPDLPTKRINIAIQPQIVISTNHTQELKYNQTIKRSSATHYLSPQYSRNTETKNQIRMKILLENNRLKSSVQSLRRDLDYHRANELKVAQILKESKQKIFEFKNGLKEKSRRIVEATQTNIHLRAVISQLQAKINHLTTYSIWQQSKIRELSSQLEQKQQAPVQVLKLKSIQATIDKYETILKNYEMNIHKLEQNHSNEASRCSLNAEIISMHTISEKSREKWGTSNQLAMQDLNNLKQKQQTVSNNPDFEILSEQNSALRLKINELQKELQLIKEEVGDRQKEWQSSMMSNLSKSDNLKDEIEQVKIKSNHMQFLLKEREDQIDRLSKEILQMKDDLENKRQIKSDAERGYLQEIEQLNKLIDGKDEQINQFKQKIIERQDYIKKIQYEQQMVTQQKELKYERHIKQLQSTIKKCHLRNEQLQKRNQYLTAKTEQMENNQEQNDNYFQSYRKMLEEKGQLLETIDKLKDQIEQLNHKSKQQQNQYEEKLEQVHQELAVKEHFRNIESAKMDKCAREISELKSKLQSISLSQIQQTMSHHQRVIEEQQEEEQSAEESSIMREGELQGNKEYYIPRKYEKESFGVGPLDQQEPLRQSSQSSRADIRIPRPQSSSFSQNIIILQQKLQEQRSSHNFSLVQMNYKLDEQRQKNAQIKDIISELQQKMKLMSIESVEKKLAYEIKQQELQKMKQRITQNTIEYEQHIEKLNKKIVQNTQQLKQKSEVNFQLGLELERMKTQNIEISHRVYNLENNNKKHSSQRIILENELSRMKNQWNNISQQNNVILQKKIEELKSSLEGQLQSKYQEKELYFSERMQQKESQISAVSNAKLVNLQERINQLEFELQKSQERDAVFKQQRATAELKVERMQQEIEELQNRCANLNMKLNQKQKQIADQYQTIRHYQVELKVKRQELNEATLNKGQLEQSVRELLLQRQEINKQFDNKNIENGQLTVNLENVKKQSNLITSKMESLQEQVSIYVQNEQSYQNDKQKYEIKLHTIQNLMQQQQYNIEKTCSGKQQLSNNNFKIITDLSEYISKIKQPEETKQSLIAKLNEALEMNTQLQLQIKHLKEYKQIAEKQNLELANQLIKIQQTIKIKDIKIEELDNNVANLLSSLEYSRTENSDKLVSLRESLVRQNELNLSLKMEEVLYTKREMQSLRSQVAQLIKQQKSTAQEYLQFKMQTQILKGELTLKMAKIEELQQANSNFNTLIQSKSDQIISITNTVTQKEHILQQQTILLDTKNQKITGLQGIIERMNKDMDDYKQKVERQKQNLRDHIEVSKNMIQQLEDDHQMKTNKLQKQISNLKLIVDQTQKQTSQRVESSTYTINEIQNKLKMQVQLTKQKSQQIKDLRQTNNVLKEINQMLKKSEARFQQQRQRWQQINHQKEQEISATKAQILRINSQINIKMRQNEQIQNQSSTLTAELNKFKAQVEDIVNQKHTLQNQLKQLKVKVSKSEHQKLFMSTTIQNLQLKIKKLEEELAELRKEYQVSISQIHKTQVYLQDEILQKSRMEQLYQSLQIQKEQIYQKVNHLSAERQQIEQRARRRHQSLQQECIKMKQQIDILNSKILQLEKQVIKLQKEKKQIEESLAKTREYLQEEIMQKSRVQELHQKIMEEKSEMELKLSQVILEYSQIRESVKNNQVIDELKQENEGFKLRISKIEKQHLGRMQLLRTQSRDHGLELERKHSKQVEDLCEQLSKLRTERDSYRIEFDKARKLQRQSKEEHEKLKIKINDYEKQVKNFENQRGELTDKILQLTQQNNEFNQIIQNMRTDLMSKGNELFEYKEIIEKLQEENQELKENPLIQNVQFQGQNQNFNELEQEYYQLKAVVLQLQAKNEILQTQINQKIKIQRTLTEKLEQMKVRETRERNSSCDSYVSRSRIFIDEKSQNMQAELEDYKCKYESAQAYIQTLQEQIKKNSNSQLELKIAALEKETNAIKQQNQNLQVKADFQNAYIDHLQSDNIKNSMISKKSSRSRKDDKSFLKVDKDNSVVSVFENSHRSERPAQIQKINDKIKSMNDFVQKFNREKDSEKDSGQILKQFRKNLSNATLDQLLGTIIYRLDKEANQYREKQHQNEQISMDNQQLQEQIKELHHTLELMSKKLELNHNVQAKYEEAKSMLQQTLMIKVKQEMEIAQFKRRVQQLQNTLPPNSQENIRNKEQKLLTSSICKQKQKEKLSVLQQENEDGSSDSMMSENAESQIPSSLQQSKELKCSLDFRLKEVQTLQEKKKKLPQANNTRNNEKIFTIQFLYKLLDKIDQIDSQVAYIQFELEEKSQILAEILGNDTFQETLVGKMQQIQTKLHESQKDLRRHKQKSQNQIANIFRQFIKSIEIQEYQGLPLQNKKRIEEYLKLLEQQLNKTKQMQQQKTQQIQIEIIQQNSKLNLQEIKQDIINEDRSSSIVNPKNSRIGNSYSNSQGGVESLENNEAKTNYSQILKELKQVNQELANKDEKLRNFIKRGNLINRQVTSIIDQLLLNFDENQYICEQTDKIKQILNQLFVDDMISTPVKDSFQKGQEYQKMLIESNAKKKAKQEDQKSNYIMQLTKLSPSRFNEMIEEISNQELRLLKKNIEETIEFRYQDCLEFLNYDQSLILDILEVNEETSAEEQIMQKLANKLTKVEITGIITNSSNKKEARMTLMRIIAQDSRSQMVSNQNDFSPDLQKMHQIRSKVFANPTQLSLLLHNQLVKILGAPTRQSFYDLIEEYYQIIRRKEQKISQQAIERESLSQSHSLRLKNLLQQPIQSMQIDGSQRLEDYIQIRISKARSSSCVVNSTEANIDK